MTLTKQKQIEDFIIRNQIDILHCQEINIDQESFSQCYFIEAYNYIIDYNALNKYGTATLVKNTLTAENIRFDTLGRSIFFNIEDITLGNVYLQSGTDGISRGARESYCSETLPQLLTNRKPNGVVGGDLNCITKKIDCTHNPESKQSPSLARLVNTFDLLDSYRAIHPHSKTFSRYYSGAGGYVGASRIDWSYHWGNVAIEEASYISVAFLDHFAFSIKISLPILSKILPPQCRPLFKISPEVVHDREFKARLETEMVVW